MNVCPRCKRKYSPDTNFCPDDGAKLAHPSESLIPDDPMVGTRLADQFELRSVIGKGSMGTVYRAWQATMERDVAIKVLRPDLLHDDQIVRRFSREARAAARLAHPNIITVHVVGETNDGRPFMAMEHIAGHSLDEVIESDGALPPVRALHIARQICSALAEAHASDIIHRDLKPANILLSKKRTTVDFVKVLDFGIAKILTEGEESHLTQTGAIFGTPYYISPEQASGSDLDARCDLYALGVILFQMTTGKLPFRAKSGMEVLIQHLKETPPSPRELNPALPQRLEKLILRLLQKEPSQRWASAEELGHEIDLLAERLIDSKSPPHLSAAVRLQASSSTLAAIEQSGETSLLGDYDDPASTRRAQTPISSLGRDSQAITVDPSDTKLLQKRMQRRRPVAFHGLFTLVAIGLGVGIGWGVFALERPKVKATRPVKRALAPAAKPSSSPIAPSKANKPPSAVATKPAAQKKPKPTKRNVAAKPAVKHKTNRKSRRKKYRRRRRARVKAAHKRSVKPLAATPKVAKKKTPKTVAPLVPVEPKPKPKPTPKPKPKPAHDHDHGHDHKPKKVPAKKDDIYDLVD
jgi:serine/threonine protein kinase